MGAVQIYAIIAFPVFGTFVFLSAPTLLINHYHHPPSTIHHLPQLSTSPLLNCTKTRKMHCVGQINLPTEYINMFAYFILYTSICIWYITLIIEVFLGTWEMERKEKPLKISCQNPVEQTQYNFRTRLEPKSLLWPFLIRWAPFWQADMHTIHTREWRAGLKPVTQPVWPVCPVQTLRRHITHAQQDFDTISLKVFLLPPFFACQEKPLRLCYQGNDISNMFIVNL